MCLWLYMTLEDCNLPTEPLAAMAAASSKTSTIPARTVAEFLLFASRWPRSCWITKCECWDWKKNNKKPRKLLTCLEKKKNTEKKKRVREKVTENCCIEVIRLIKWQTKNWILVIKCITPLHFSFRPKMNHSCEQIGWSPNWNQWELHEYWSTFLLCTTKMCNNHLQR